VKDKEARGRINALEGDMGRLRLGLEELGRHILKGVKIRDCPVCKHSTLQQEGNMGFFYVWLCLNCGSKLVCETKTECKVVKEEK